MTSLWRIDWRKQSSVDFKCLDFELGVPNIRDLLTCETDFYWHLDIHSLELIGEEYLHGQPWEFGFISERSVKRTQPRCSDDPGCSSRRLVHCFLSILWIFLVLHTALVYRLLHFAECVSQKNLRLLNELVNAYYSLANEWLDIILV